MHNLKDWLTTELQTELAHREVLAGGDICQTERVITTDGREFCVKQKASAPRDFFPAEAAGLEALAASNTLRVPEVYAVQPSFIAMEYIAPGRRETGYWEQLGYGLAGLHSQAAPAFGFTGDNFCGTTPQPNPKATNGYEFFAQQRLLYQGHLAVTAGYLEKEALVRLEQLCQRLPELIPPQAPALLHGDLWGGNIHCDINGTPVLIDPACYWGWPEADLAMTQLFGGFGAGFYRAYQERRPLAPNWHERAPLYNLYHLLNHLNLFGSSYRTQVIQILGRFT